MKVSDQKLPTITLIRHRTTGQWYSTRWGWVDGINDASIVSPNRLELLMKLGPLPEEWQVTTFAPVPF